MYKMINENFLYNNKRQQLNNRLLPDLEQTHTEFIGGKSKFLTPKLTNKKPRQQKHK